MSIKSEKSPQLSANQRSLIALREMRDKLEAIEQAKSEPIAIIGMGCRFPGGVTSPDEYWQLLRNGVDAVSPAPSNRWVQDASFNSEPADDDKNDVVYGSFLDSVDQFDPEFFGITPREAKSMDPQQRLLLEVSWEALERSGHAPSQLLGTKTGVYVGISTRDYSIIMNKLDADKLDLLYAGTGGAFCIASGRLSYTLGLQGPNLAVDTACSSSLVAIHLACQDLRAGKSEMALAAGVNLLLGQDAFESMSAIGAIAPDGRCKTFAAQADGYGRGEGCGVIVLKRLSDAEANGDNVLAVIRGSAINNDGRTSGLTVPSATAQKAVILEALKDGLVDACEVDFVEAHGTGTELGDPIEVRALVDALCSERLSDHPLKVGAVKTNIGHLEAAAGVAGLIKVVLSLQHQEIPRHLHFEQPSTHIPWQEISVDVPTKQTPWTGGESSRTAGVSAFGFSGTNAHVILSEAPQVASDESATVVEKSERPINILCLSARSETALSSLVSEYRDHLAGSSQDALADVCFTANSGRSHFEHRLVVQGDSVSTILSGLDAISTGQTATGCLQGTCNSGGQQQIVFLFTGQGSQYIGMGRELYDSEPVFRDMLDRCDAILAPAMERSLLSVIFADGEDKSTLNKTEFTQPAMFAIEYALACLYRAWGIEPTIVAGHSVGEYVAACIAGVFSLEDALQLVSMRGRLMQELQSDGDMAAVFAGEERVLTAIAGYEGKVSIAAFNGAQNTVVSGERKALGEILQKLEQDGIGIQRLTVSHAFHSPLMKPMIAAFREAARDVEYKPARITLVSNVTGQSWGASEIHGADYWCQHILAPVRFDESIDEICKSGPKLFLEIGPHPTLIGLATYDRGSTDSVWIPSLRREHSDWQQLMNSLGQLYVSGVSIDWKSFDQGYKRQRVALPTYPFDRRRYWVSGRSTATSQSPGPAMMERDALHPLIGSKHRSASSEVVFEGVVDLNSVEYLNDHCFYGEPVFPATAYVEIALAASGLSGNADVEIQDMILLETMMLARDQPTVIQVILSREQSGEKTFKICSISTTDYDADGEWQMHAKGTLCGREEVDPAAFSLSEIRDRCSEEVSVASLYQQSREIGIEYGPMLQGMQRVWRTDGEAIAELSLPRELLASNDRYIIHPVLLDAGIQVMGAALGGVTGSDVYMPVGIGRQRVFSRSFGEVYAHAVVRKLDGSDTGIILGDIRLLDTDGNLLSETSNLQIKKISKNALLRNQKVNVADWLYYVDWYPAPLEIEAEDILGSWLVFADNDGVGDELIAWLEQRGDRCVSVTPGDVYQCDGNDHVRINPSEPEDMLRALTEVENADGPALRGIIYMWALDSAISDESSPTELNDDAERIHTGALNVLNTAARHGGDAPPRLWLLTRGAQMVGAQTEPSAPIQSSLWGLGGVIALEHPRLRCARMDLDPRADNVSVAQALGMEIRTDDIEDRIALRGGSRYVARLFRDGIQQPGPSLDLDKPYQLDIAERGLLDSMSFMPLSRAEPVTGEVEIEIVATALNFRDVLNALGTYAGEPGPLGNECSGRVTAVGIGVEGLAIGDSVLALTGGTFSSHVTTDARFVVPIPENLSPAEAVTIPVTFLTSAYALSICAGLEKGQRVLIHAAAGGVGMSAVQIARRAGAEIFATAGSPRKRELLKSLGIVHVMDSRSLDFADEIMAITNGEGVDVVLNSLNGEFIPKSLSVLAKNGFFLEIGKAGIWTPEQLAQSRPDVNYDIIYLGESVQKEPDLIRELFNKLMTGMRNGELKPLPRHDFPMSRVVDAYRFMAAAKHIGKVVVYRDHDDHALLATSSQMNEAPDDNGTYLVTGGLGGLGLEAASRLVADGAKNLLLFARSKPQDKAMQRVEEFRRNGVQVQIEQGDVSNEDDVRRIIESAEGSMPPLRGVVHCAGVLDDGVLAEQSWPRFAKVMAAKVLGAWNLHRLTLQADLQFFVMFSSIASMLGSPGQGNYAAANAFLDGLAAYRRSSGLHGLSLNWGAWSEVGMAADGGDRVGASMAKFGAAEIVPEHGLDVLDKMLSRNCAQMGVLPMNWNEYFGNIGDAYPPLLGVIALQSKATSHTVDLGGAFLQKFENAPDNERGELVSNYVRDTIVRVLNLNDVPPAHQSLTEIGMDSLLAVELSNQFEREVGAAVSISSLLQGPTIAEFGALMLEQLSEPNSSRPVSENTTESQDWEDGEL